MSGTPWRPPRPAAHRGAAGRPGTLAAGPPRTALPRRHCGRRTPQTGRSSLACRVAFVHCLSFDKRVCEDNESPKEVGTSLLRPCEQPPVCRADIAAGAHLQRVVCEPIELGAAQAAGGVDALLGWVCLGRVHQEHILHRAGQSLLPQGSREQEPSAPVQASVNVLQHAAALTSADACLHAPI